MVHTKQNLNVARCGYFESDIERYEIILADLATIKRAIKNDKQSIRIFEDTYDRYCIYEEIEEILVKAGFEVDVEKIDADGYVTVYLFPFKEMEEKWFGKTFESWSVYDEEALMDDELNGLMM